MGQRNKLQPWRYFGICLAFFGLVLPKLGVFSGINGAVGIWGAVILQCLIHRVLLALDGKRNFIKNNAWKKFENILCLLWCAGVLAVVLALAAGLTGECFWTGMPWYMALIFCTLMLLPGLGKPGRVWQRMTAVSFSTVNFFLTALPLMAARQHINMYRTISFIPETRAAVTAGVLYFLFSWYLLLLPKSGRRAMWPDSKEGLYLLNGLALSGICILLGLVYGSEGSSYRRWPILTLLQGVSVPGEFLERVDTFWVAAAVFALFLAAGLLLGRMGYCLQALGVSRTSACVLRRKDIAATALLAALVLLYGYQGVEAQNRSYISALSVDRQQGDYVFRFYLQAGEETIETSGGDFCEVKEKISRKFAKTLDFGHVEATILGEDLLEDREAASALFAELAAWQDMDENSYVFHCADMEKLTQADLGDASVGQYLTGIYENHFGRLESYPTLGELMTDWENGVYDRSIPEIYVEEGMLLVSPFPE